jgi:hypothetical protein
MASNDQFSRDKPPALLTSPSKAMPCAEGWASKMSWRKPAST